jgi:hypothetical protein
MPSGWCRLCGKPVGVSTKARGWGGLTFFHRPLAVPLHLILVGPSKYIIRHFLPSSATGILHNPLDLHNTTTVSDFVLLTPFRLQDTGNRLQLKSWLTGGECAFLPSGPSRRSAGSEDAASASGSPSPSSFGAPDSLACTHVNTLKGFPSPSSWAPHRINPH